MQLLAKAVLWLHVSLYRLTSGRIGGCLIAGSPILLLTTTGRRTGKRRTRSLAYVRDDEGYVLCASNGGSSTHPGWYHNLSATGRAEVQVGPEHLAVRARTADLAERRRLFPRFVEMYKGCGATSTRPAARSRWCYCPQTGPAQPLEALAGGGRWRVKGSIAIS